MSAAGLNIPFCRSGGMSSMKTPPKSYGVSARTSSGLGDRERRVAAPWLFAPLIAGPRQIAIQLREAEFLFLTFLSIPPRRRHFLVLEPEQGHGLIPLREVPRILKQG